MHTLRLAIKMSNSNSLYRPIVIIPLDLRQQTEAGELQVATYVMQLMQIYDTDHSDSLLT